MEKMIKETNEKQTDFSLLDKNLYKEWLNLKETIKQLKERNEELQLQNRALIVALSKLQKEIDFRDSLSKEEWVYEEMRDHEISILTIENRNLKKRIRKLKERGKRWTKT